MGVRVYVCSLRAIGVSNLFCTLNFAISIIQFVRSCAFRLNILPVFYVCSEQQRKCWHHGTLQRCCLLFYVCFFFHFFKFVVLVYLFCFFVHKPFRLCKMHVSVQVCVVLLRTKFKVLQNALCAVLSLHALH